MNNKERALAINTARKELALLIKRCNGTQTDQVFTKALELDQLTHNWRS
jgi:hypothetical protein